MLASRTALSLKGSGENSRDRKIGVSPQDDTAGYLVQRSYGRDDRDRITWWKRGTDN